MDDEDILTFIKKLGVPYRHPHSNFFQAGNEDCQSLKAYGICDYDNEEFYHKPYPSFSCHIPGCERTFETVIQYESHYNSCHSFTCIECNKNLPNYHLLDLHISETHDFFFKEQAKRNPMYRCFLEDCKECFMNPKDRRDHCIQFHKFPSDFRFDSYRKKVGPKKKKKKKVQENKMEIVESNEESNQMEVSENKTTKNENKKGAEFKGFMFGYSQRKRKPVFNNFSKDLMNSLPNP